MRLPPLAAVALLLAATLAAAQTGGAVASTVASGEDIVGDRFRALPTKLVFIDSDRDGVLDHDDPVEPVYLDAHDDGVLNRGDVRITGGLGAAGTSVDLGDPDFGLEVRVLSAWFAATARGDWFVDVDNSRSVTGNDLRLTGARAGERVDPLDSDVGASTPAIQADVSQDLRIGWTDPDGDGRVDPGEPILLDLQRKDPASPQEVEVGDLRFDNVVAAPDASGADAGTGVGAGAGDGGASDDAGTGGDAAAGSGGGGEDDEDETEWGLILAVVDLVALAGLAFLVLRKKPE